MIYDLIVIGGGPAGIISAIRASENGAQVLLVEKNNSLGVKLLITGHGRCNITNIKANNKGSLEKYGSNYRFLYSIFHNFSVEKTLKFFKEIGVKTKIQDNGRVFPKSDKAQDVLDSLVKKLRENKVKIKYRASVKDLKVKNNKIEKIKLHNGGELRAKNFIIATGGKSYPLTGSIGDGYKLLKKLGHTINTPRPALTPIILKEKYIKTIEGLSLKDVNFNIYENNKKKINSSGDIIFTFDGISGPGIIDISSRIGAILSSNVSIKFDFFPELSLDDLNKKLQKDFHKFSKKQLKNYFASMFSLRLATLIINLCKVNKEKKVNAISKTERIELSFLLKNFSFEIAGLKDFNKAMITAGGVDTREINPKTMKSKIVNNLYIVGEVLDLDGPSGGYNLQICWSTGYVAGGSIDF